MTRWKKNYDEMWRLGWGYWKVGLLIYGAVALIPAFLVGFFVGFKWAVTAWSGSFSLLLVFWLVMGLTDGWSHAHPNEGE